MEQQSCFLGLLVYLIGYSSSEITNLGKGYNWNQAIEACESMGSSLPKVTVTGTGFGYINDIQHKNFCIWLKATYERTDNMTDDTYPNRCCEIMFRDQYGTANKECVPCKGRYGYLCASGNNTISWQYSINVDDAPWWNAAQYCSTYAFGLPSDTNTEFLQNLQYIRVMWVNGVRTLNTNPTKGDGMFPVCSCDGLVHLTCPSNTWTYCVLESMNAGRSESASYFTTPLSTYSNVPKLSNGNLQASTDSTTKASSEVPKSSTRNLEDANVLDAAQTTRENEALIGGVSGAGLVLTMIIVIVVVFLLRRSKPTQNKNSNSQSTVNHDNLLKAKIHMNNAYDDVNGEVPKSDNHALIQIKHMEKESTTCATPTKVQGSSEVTRDNYSGIMTNEEQSRTGVYSEVQTRPKTGPNLHTMNQNTAGDDEYDKINFDKSYQAQQAEHVGNVYDKTNFYCEHREEYLENVYIKAEFYHKRQNMDAGNVYDKANFHGGQQERHSENAHIDEKRESPGRHSENVYDKAYFHCRPQDERSGYVYDKIKL